MPLYNVTLKEGASAGDLDKAKQKAIKGGGQIKHEFTLIKGFTVEFEDDQVSVLSSDDKINVEQDGEVTTQ